MKGLAEARDMMQIRMGPKLSGLKGTDEQNLTKRLIQPY